MANAKFELKVVMVIDTNIESIVNQLEEIKTDILSGEAQKEMLETDGIVRVSITLNEIKQ
jgi:hypothetical protein